MNLFLVEWSDNSVLFITCIHLSSSIFKKKNLQNYKGNQKNLKTFTYKDAVSKMWGERVGENNHIYIIVTRLGLNLKKKTSTWQEIRLISNLQVHTT